MIAKWLDNFSNTFDGREEQVNINIKVVNLKNVLRKVTTWVILEWVHVQGLWISL